MRAAGYECHLPHTNCCQAELNMSYSCSFLGALSVALQREVLRAEQFGCGQKRRICSAFIVVIYQSRFIRKNVLRSVTCTCCERRRRQGRSTPARVAGMELKRRDRETGAAPAPRIAPRGPSVSTWGDRQSYGSPNALSAGTFAMMPASLPVSPGGISL
jgi:hypothetical protein